MRVFSLISVTLLLLSGCAARLHTDEHTSKPVRSNRTVVLFMVDGLGAKILQTGIASGRMPNTKNFFLKGKKQFALGQASFPTLTYPNLASVLTARAVGEQPVNANKMVLDGKTLNYESPFHHDDLDDAVNPHSVFERLTARGQTSASFAYVLGKNATDHMGTGLVEGLQYQHHEYRELDARLLEKMAEYLADKPDVKTWPAFIYVHLVGVDGTAHLFGGNSRQTQEYLAWLDKKLQPVFQQLSRGEKRKQTLSILTSDHGFVDTVHFVDVEKFVKKANSEIVITNESRFLGLYLSKGGDRAKFEKTLASLRQIRGVEMTVSRRASELYFSTARQQLTFQYGPPSALCAGSSYSLAPGPQGGLKQASLAYQCPEALNPSVQPYPLLVSGLSRYMNSANHPDAVVIPRPDTSFTDAHKGNHGGPTADEMLVPVLMRNATLGGGTILRTSDLLKTLDTL